jgi:hypothetical protein
LTEKLSHKKAQKFFSHKEAQKAQKSSADF